jgi:hypothetical protein
MARAGPAPVRAAPSLNGGDPCTPPSSSLAGAPSPAPLLAPDARCAQTRHPIRRRSSANDWLIVPGLGCRKAARHPELTYPIRFNVLRPQTLECPFAAWLGAPCPSTSLRAESWALDRVSQGPPEPCKYNRGKLVAQATHLSPPAVCCSRLALRLNLAKTAERRTANYSLNA